jgi:hypothetical protein
MDNDCNGMVDEGDLCPPEGNARRACRGGRCVLEMCNAGFRTCNAACISDDTPCGTDCPGGRANCGGRCVPQSQLPPETCNGKDDDCNGSIDDKVSCPNPPNGRGVCNGNSGCGVTCDGGFNLCGAACISSNDLNNCGRCGNRCMPNGGTAICANGSCDVSCSGTTLKCKGACVPSDDSNCGRCDNRCTGNLTCLGSQCGCRGGFHSCPGGTCAADNDATKCGTGCVTCPGGGNARCNGGTCDCASGFFQCGGTCLSTRNTDLHNCGSCNRTCMATQDCVAGTCKDKPCDLAGNWRQSSTDCMSTWSLNGSPPGPWSASESGCGNATGTARISFDSIVLTFTFADPADPRGTGQGRGTYTWQLGNCQGGSGNLHISEGSFAGLDRPSTFTRGN